MHLTWPFADSAFRPLDPAGLLDQVEFFRLDAARHLDRRRQAALGQYFTSATVAKLMAGMSSLGREEVRILDAGAGVGTLTAAWVARACAASERPRRIQVSAFEIDEGLRPFLQRTLELCREVCRGVGVEFQYTTYHDDFIASAVRSINGGIFGNRWPAFDLAILNPPYKKIRSDSEERRLLSEVGIETGNLYAAFVSLALRSLDAGGELIAITPRSFCNGPYFTPFRKDLLRLASLTHLHVFDSRDVAFGGDEVLQETVVFRAERALPQQLTVQVEWSEAGHCAETERRPVPFVEVVRPGDTDAFIHVVPDEWGGRVAQIISALKGSLATLDLEVSTGRVVDFRAKECLRKEPEAGTVPLIYPTHFDGGRVSWPKVEGKKPNALVLSESVEGQVNENGTYVLVKRFSSKEECRRVVAALFTPDAAPGQFVAFENHLNYFHCHGRGLSRSLAQGLTAYLNTTLVDSYFRQFNGHTQVNATDLRKLPYPTTVQLERIGKHLSDEAPEQSELDDIVEGELLNVADQAAPSEPAEHRIQEAISILKALGLPREQTNERAALTLLALLDLKPRERWSGARNPLRGVTPIMEFAAEHYGKLWKPNTRETVRRFTLHQFRDAGLVAANPDRPDRPVNSPAYCYQVPESILGLLRLFGTSGWDRRLAEHLASAPTLAQQYAKEREMQRIPLRLPEGQEISLSPGGQNELIEKIISDFCSRFTPGAQPVYVGDADAKWGYFDESALAALGIRVNSHGKMPDVVVHYTEKNWLVLIEAVTSHGPVNPKRRGELKELFGSSTAPLVFVTAFLSRQAMVRYLNDIAWETEVWVAEAPSHLIHFNGERFLGPYE